MRFIPARSSDPSDPQFSLFIRWTSSNTSTMLGLTNTPSIPAARLYAGRTPEQASMEILLAPSVEAEPEVTLDAAQKTLMEPVVRLSTQAVEVWSLCYGTRRNCPSGGSRVMRSLGISTTDAPTRIVGEPPSPAGRTSLVTLTMRSEICNVCPVRFTPLNVKLKYLRGRKNHRLR